MDKNIVSPFFDSRCIYTEHFSAAFTVHTCCVVASAEC